MLMRLIRLSSLKVDAVLSGVMGWGLGDTGVNADGEVDGVHGGDWV
jgi:hypothetical protein